MVAAELLYLQDALTDGDERRIIDAIGALAQRCAPDETRWLLPLTEHALSGVRSASCEALAELDSGGDGPVLDALLTCLGDIDELVRVAAAETLGRVGATQAGQALALALGEDPSDLVRASCVEALGLLRDAAHEPAVVAALGHADTTVRMFAAWALGVLAGPLALTALRAALAAEVAPEVRVEALGALYRLGEGGAVAELAALSLKADEAVAIGVLNLLQDLVVWAQPATLVADGPRLEAMARKVGARHEVLRPHAQALCERLRSLGG